MSRTTTRTQSPLSRAWNWSVERSPLLNATRWILNRGYPNAQARDLITAANLPDQLSKLIDTTVTKTKLWRSERADIARELIAHTQDALEANRTPEQITESFGHPKKTAKLLRRATKRKRPLYWRTLRNIRRIVATLTLLIFLTYGSLAARFYIGKPNITKNYAVMINAQNDAYTEDEKAWPVYKEVFPAWRAHIQETQDRQIAREEATEFEDRVSVGIVIFPQIPLDHPDYTETVQLFKDFEPQFKRLREATHRPIIGIDLGFNEVVYHEDGSYESKFTPPSKNPEDDPSFINMLLPHLGTMRQFANILAFDTLIAARESDNQRTYENLSAMLAMTRQKNFDQTLISDLVNTAIADMTADLIAQVIREYPTTLTRDHLLALSHELAITTPTLGYSFEGEVMMFEDILQRAYTDNGNGNGRLTHDGINLLMYLNWMKNTDPPVTPAQLALGPISSAIIGDRRSQSQLHQRMIKTIKDVTDLGPQHIALLTHQDGTLNQTDNYAQHVLYSPVQLVMPALAQAVSRSFVSTMTLDAAAAVLAIKIYKHDKGHLPESLTKLTPNYLPALPQDLFNPNHPLQYKVTAHGYILYSYSSDGDDDQAILQIEEKYMMQPSFIERYPAQLDEAGNIILDNAGNPKLAPPTGPDGDWILFDMNAPAQAN